MTDIEHTPSFAAMGHLIATARARRGMETQGELAARLGVSQQSVSRWEAGTHRPRPAQLSALATVLEVEIGDLLQLAAYDAPPAEAFVDQFPVDRFATSTIFEQFVQHLVAALYPEADVRRAGGSGHTQDGADIVAVASDGTVSIFQCKHVSRFGPAEVRKAVEACRGRAARKYLVLSRVASPQTAAEVQRHPGWTLWDKDDLSRIVRQKLAPETQDRLVDTFFRGQRQALLGRPEPGPWLTAEEFFRPFARAETALSHGWSLVGRAEETARLLGAVDATAPPIGLLVAPAGMGKSRLLKELAHSFARAEPGTTLRFLSREGELTPAALAALGAAPKLLIVDDAHDRESLALLFRFVASPANQARAVIATRPYAEQRIRNEAAVYSLVDLPAVQLERPTKNELTALAVNVLRTFDADIELAEAVVQYAGDSPLTTAMVARIIAQERRPLELIRSEPAFRDVILGKFARVVLGDIGRPRDEALHKDLLDVLALAQPFHPTDPQLLAFIEATKGIEPSRAAEGLRTLVEGGIVLKRGHQHRLMPDVLGDYIIERSCLDASGALSPFAHKALAAVPNTLLSNVFVNLARLDWRRAEGDPAKSRLLETVWRSLDNITEDWDPRLDAVKLTAGYQPGQALALMTRLFHRGVRVSAMAEILRTIAFAKEECFEHACILLWELGRIDRRPLGPHPSHPLRALSGIGEYRARKSLRYSELILEFSFRLMEKAENWQGSYTPLELLMPLLRGDGEDTRSDPRSVTFMPFFVIYEVVQPLRAKIIDKVLELLRHPRVSVARAAAAFVENLIRPPHGTFNAEVPEGLDDIYQDEFAVTLERLGVAVREGLAPIVTFTVARTISWHAQYGRGRCPQIARSILDALPTGLEFRLLAAVLGEFRQTFVEHRDPRRWTTDLDTGRQAMAVDLCATFPGPEERRSKIEATMQSLIDAGEPIFAQSLLMELVRQDPDFARAMLADALERPASLTRPYAGIALGSIYCCSREEGRQWASRLMRTGEVDLAQSVAEGLSCLDRGIEPADAAIMEALLRGPRPVVAAAIRTVGSLANTDLRRVINLLRCADLHADTKLADDMAMILAGMPRRIIEHLTHDDVAAFLSQIEPIPALHGYWIDELLAELSFRYPDELIDFFMRRVERAASTESYGFRAANYGPHSHRRLRLLEAEDGLRVLRRMWRWLADNRDRDVYFQHAASHAFDAMFLHSLDLVVQLFEPEIPTAPAEELQLIARLLGQAHHSFVFTYDDFVIRFIERCAEVDPELATQALSSFFASSISGIRSGVFGEPMPQDLEQLARAKRVLARLSIASRAYQLYDWIRSAAEQNIAQAHVNAEALADQ